MKRIVFGIAFALMGLSLIAQVTVADPDNMAPDQEITILVDLTQTSNEWGIIETAAGGEDMYIWTWKPVEHPQGHPLANGIGATAWKNSNEALKMTLESPGIYSFTMTPTEFYGVTPKEVYDNDIHFLVKPKDGGGYGDPDHKTEDLVLNFELPPGPSRILYAFPSTYGADLDSLKLAKDDVFSVVYDAKAELKTSMQDATDVYMYIELTGTDDQVYKVAPNAKVLADYPELRMKDTGEQVFQASFLLSNFIDMFNLPTGIEAKQVTIQVAKPDLKTTADLSDEDIFFNLVLCD